MIRPPAGANPFEFIVISGQRAAQLMRGCVPKIESDHKLVLKAQLEVATGAVTALPIARRAGDQSQSASED